MKPPASKQAKANKAFLSVSYKAAELLHSGLHSRQEAVIVTNSKLQVTDFNKTAQLYFGLTNSNNKAVITDAINFQLKNTSGFKALITILKKGNWEGEITFTNTTGEQFCFYTTATLVDNNNSLIIASKLVEEESRFNTTAPENYQGLFKLFMENNQTGCCIYDDCNTIVFANNIYSDALEYDGNPIGKHLSEIFPEELATKLMIRNKKVLDSNGPIISEYSNKKHDGSMTHFVANAFIFKTADNKRYIGAQSIDITDRKRSEEQIKKIHERFTYVVNATSEAIWDFDLKTNEIYRNDAFYTISGYSKKELAGNLDWWFDKVHPEDKERVKKNFEQELTAGKKTWEDEYRFQYADGTYRNILDKGFAIYENNKPVRLIGAIQDITARKKLESQLLNEQVKKQKLINQATIDAQEKERNMISAELHDNVNQLLMSAKLHIGAAKNSDIQNELLDKASDYLLQAVEEIRSLSKRLNTSIVRSVGLEESIFDICRNMKQFNDITVSIKIDKTVIDKLTKEQQLVIFRIIQEQSNNIIKYSRADAVTITLSEKNNQCSLLVSDNGIGFDKEKQKATGIGFINIFNRVDAYNGKVEIITYPENGCTLNISIPYVI